MQSRINFLLIICLVTTLTFVAFAQDKTVTTPAFPYTAEILTDNVNVRCGAGTAYYACGQLNKGDKVKVVSQKFSWSRIVPPPGSFSWISKLYININPSEPKTGVITGDNVRIYAGAKNRRPIHSDRVQTHRSRGEKVELLGPEEDGYYKITPPKDAYLWVKTDFLKPLPPKQPSVAPIEKTTPKPEPQAKPKPKPQPEPKETTIKTPPVNFTTEADRLDKYHQLQEKINAEKAKPIDKQNYTDIKKSLQEITKDNDDKAARYSKFTLGQIERIELALQVNQAVQMQNKQLLQTSEKIQQARTTRLDQIPDLGKYAVIGKLQPSNVYDKKQKTRHYIITDPAGKIKCYALPDESARNLDLSNFINQNVGLVGTIEPHQQTSSALVRFTKIVALN